MEDAPESLEPVRRTPAGASKPTIEERLRDAASRHEHKGLTFDQYLTIID